MALPLSTTPSYPQPPSTSLPRKLFLLLMLAIDVVIGLVYLLYYGNPVGYLGDLILVSGILGLVMGFGSRVILRGRRPGLRMLAAVSMQCSGLFLIGILTGWRFGLGPLSFQPGGLDWSGAVQLAFGSLSAILAMYAWRKPAPEGVPIPDEPERLEPLPAAVPNPPIASKRERNPRRAIASLVARTGAGRTPPRSKASAAIKTRARKKDRGGSSPRVRTGREKVFGSGQKRRKNRSAVQFTATEEHRCPYCLELVQPDDPRGIVECKVCHTLHHADCWAITGTCQVPHLNS